MEKKKMGKKRLDRSWQYVIVTYLVFGAMVLGICGGASMIFHASPLVMRILSNVCAWSPTLVLFAAFKKWCPDASIEQYMKKAFGGKLRAGLLIISILSTGATFIIAAGIYALIKQVPVSGLFQLGGYPVLASILFSLLSGPTGEECGWRGYLRHEFSKKYGFVKGNLLVGIVWTFWHAVLWLVDSDYTSGVEMLIYILSNIVVITSIHMIMAVILEKEDNLIYAVLVHLFFNLPYCFVNVDITFYVVMMVLYPVVAGLFMVWRKCFSCRFLFQK